MRVLLRCDAAELLNSSFPHAFSGNPVCTLHVVPRSPTKTFGNDDAEAAQTPPPSMHDRIFPEKPFARTLIHFEHAAATRFEDFEGNTHFADVG